MNLTVNRTKHERGIFKKSTLYYLEVDLEATQKEWALITNNDRVWNYHTLCGGRLYGKGNRGAGYISLNLGEFLGKKTRWAFGTIADLVYFENDLIEGVRKLKERVQALAAAERHQIEYEKQLKQQAADFVPEGPRKIEL